MRTRMRIIEITTGKDAQHCEWVSLYIYVKVFSKIFEAWKKYDNITWWYKHTILKCLDSESESNVASIHQTYNDGFIWQMLASIWVTLCSFPTVSTSTNYQHVRNPTTSTTYSSYACRRYCSTGSRGCILRSKSTSSTVQAIIWVAEKTGKERSFQTCSKCHQNIVKPSYFQFKLLIQQTPPWLFNLCFLHSNIRYVENYFLPLFCPRKER